MIWTHFSVSTVELRDSEFFIVAFLKIGPSGGIRTHDPLLPKQMR